MKFLRISNEIKDEYMSFLNEFKEKDGSVTPYGADMQDWSFDEFIEVSENYEAGKLPDPNHVPGTTLYLMVEEKIVGAINIRHELNEYLLNYGGHIGYGVRYSERGKGYATIMLKKGLEFLRSIGVEKALITCDDDNIGSRRVIEKCGGVFENAIPNKGKQTLRFWINIKSS